MKGKLLFISAAAAVITATIAGCERGPNNDRGGRTETRPHVTTSPRPQRIREPAVAGGFYPGDKEALTKAVETYLAAAKDHKIKDLRGLISPHAGYIYSGPTAAIGYKQLAGRDIQTVIVLAASHRMRFSGASIPPVDAYRTPLGLVRLSPKAVQLAKTAPFVSENAPHEQEHSLEVQLPFLQTVLKDFSLVPVVYGNVDPKAVAETLAKHLDDKTLIVASTDLSHHMPYSTANILDGDCVKAICSLDIDRTVGQFACGKLPVLTLMHIAKTRGWQAKLLDYRNSGDTAGDKSRVVGYAAIAFFAGGKVVPATAATGPASKPVTQSNIYVPEERKFLLDLARKTLTTAAKEGMIPRIDKSSIPKKLTEDKGCFVTLTKGGHLRGCIGHIFPKEPLYEAVAQMTYNAAMRDSRFKPVTPDELDEIHIEVSVLTVPKQLEFASGEELLGKLRPHVDGVVLRAGNRQATYLPQVWEQIPDKAVFLTRLSLKGRIHPEAWQKGTVTVLVYQAEAFEEGER